MSTCCNLFQNIGYMVGELMDLVVSSDTSLLSSCILVVDGDQSVVERVGVGQSAPSESGLQG